MNRRLRLRLSKRTCLLAIERVILTTVSTIGCGSTGRLLSKGPVKSFPSLYIPKNCTRSVIELYTALRTLLDISEATEAKKWSILPTLDSCENKKRVSYNRHAQKLATWLLWRSIFYLFGWRLTCPWRSLGRFWALIFPFTKNVQKLPWKGPSSEERVPFDTNSIRLFSSHQNSRWRDRFSP